MKQETIGERIQKRRRELGLTQRELAEQAGVPFPSLQGWEIDHREPGVRPLFAIAQALKVCMESLVANTVPADEQKRPPKRTRGRPPKPATTQDEEQASKKLDKPSGKKQSRE